MSVTDLQIGDPAPDFDLPTDGSGRVNLSELRGKVVVLYFYPKADTSGCTKQAQGFTEHAAEFAATDTVVIGVSKDPTRSHDKFKAKYSLDLILASAAESDMAERYGAWVKKSLYGREYMGLDRSTFLIDQHGRLRQIWRKVKVPGHVETVLKAAQDLSA